MLSATVAALACLCLARTSAQLHQPQSLRAYTPTTHKPKDINYVLATIDERLRMLDTIGAMQIKQARRLDIIQEKLDRVETTLSLKLERAQLAAERLEHRLHMLEVNIQNTIKDHTIKIETSQKQLTEIAKNLTDHIDAHKNLLEKVNGAYSDTWRRGLIMEALMRDGLALVNVTRRELADGLRALARRQRDARLNSGELEAAFTRRLNDNTYKIDLKMQEVLEVQKRFVDSCQRLQQDDPAKLNVADLLEKLIDSVINKSNETFRDLQSLQITLRSHDAKVMKLLNGGGRMIQAESSCRRLENAFKNVSQSTLKEKELQQLTEKFIALTDRADAALLKLEARMSPNNEVDPPSSDVSEAANRLYLKLKGIKSEKEDAIEDSDDWDEDDESSYFEDGGGGGSDLMAEDRNLLNAVARRKRMGTVTSLPPHRRHLHKHPYDRGPK